MAEQVKLPVIGNVNRTWVYIGGALVVGIVGYAWWTRSSGGPAPAEDALLSTESPDDRVPPATVVGEQEFQVGEQPELITTNAQWATEAISRLSEIGYDPIFASAAIGKFLLHQGLTTNERTMVQSALGMLGPPPVGGPWAITDVPVPTPTPMLPAPTGLRVANRSRTRLLVHWNPVANATSYDVFVNGSFRSRTTSNAVTLGSVTPLRPNTSYRIKVRAKNPTTTSPFSGEITGRTV